MTLDSNSNAHLRTSISTHPADAMGGMGPATAISLLLLGLALLGACCAQSWCQSLAHALAAVPLIIAFVGLVGHIYSAPILYQAGESTPAITSFTALAVALLCAGFFAASPHKAVVSLILGPSTASSHYRTVLIACIFLPVAIGGLALAGFGEFYDTRETIGITVSGSVIAISVLITVAYMLLDRSESHLSMIEKALDSANAGVAIASVSGKSNSIVFSNPTFSAMTGFSRRSASGRDLRFIIDKDENKERVLSQLADALYAGEASEFVLLCKRDDGSQFWANSTFTPVRDKAGCLTHYVSITEDITKERNSEQRLKQALKDVNRATAAMDSFIRIMSHELRGSLNAASTWVSLLEIDRTPENIDQGVAAIKHAINDQARLISDLVDATRATSPSLQLEFDEIDIGEILAATLAEWGNTVTEP